MKILCQIRVRQAIEYWLVSSGGVEHKALLLAFRYHFVIVQVSDFQGFSFFYSLPVVLE